MRQWTLWFACIWLAAAVLFPARAENARPELRAFWADGFNEGYKTPEQVDTLLQRLHDAHCNAVFAQMRKRGDAYYASHYEPWASDDTAHFDALAYLIQKAHALNPPIAVHAWINTCAVGGGASNPFNIVHLHPEWISLDPHGANYDNEATKIDPGNPDAADWTFRLYLDAARHYNLDGIHFDFVRYGGKTWGYNPVSVARFRQQNGAKAAWPTLPGTNLPDPDAEAWKQWRRDQVSALVRKVYAFAAQVNPRLIVSAAVISWGDGPHSEEEWYTKSAAMNRVYQDWRGWLQEGILDLACPMTYFQAAKYTEYQRNWSEFIKNHQYNRAATVDVGNWMNTVPQTFSLMQIARERSRSGHWPHGILLYSYAGTNASEERDAKGNRKELQQQPEFYAALSQPSSYAAAPPFPTDVAQPPMPWKTHPKAGILKGFAFTPQFDPLDGATVTIRGSGKTLTRPTDGTGFYAFIDLPPGAYRVRITAPGYATQEQRTTITPGKVATITFTLGSGAIPLTRSLADLNIKTPGAVPDGTPVFMENLLVTLGTDVFPGNLYVADARGIGFRVRLFEPPLVPFQAGDVVSVRGMLLTVDGERAIDRAFARLTDMAPMRALPLPVVTMGSELAAGKWSSGIPIRIQGTVVESGVDGFTVDDGARVQILLAGLKDFGVEATGLSVTPPAAGTRVSVTGILSLTTSSDGKTIQARLRPRSGDEIVALPPVSRATLQGAAFGVALTLFR